MQDESNTGDKKIVEGVVQKWLVFIHFVQEKLEKSREFRSEDLEENNDRKPQKRQHDHLIIQHKQMQA